MTLPLPTRLIVERRLLAALFLWPRAVELEPRHFLAAEHGVLFDALQAIGEELLDDGVARVGAFVERLSLVNPATQRAAGLADAHARDSARWYREYITTELICIAVTPLAIPDLVEQVRECPRCGR